MLPPGARPAREQRHRRAVRGGPLLEHLEVGDRRRPRRPDVHADANGRGEGEREGRVHREPPLRRPPRGEGEVGLRHRAVGERALQLLRPLRGRAAGEEARRLAVEPVRGVDLPVGEAQPRRRREGVRGVARGRVHGEPGGLVHDEERAVVEHDPEVERRLRLGLGVPQEREGEPRDHAGGGLQPAAPVLALEPVLDEELDPLAREALDLLLEVAVEPPAGVVRLDGEPHPDHVRHRPNIAPGAVALPPRPGGRTLAGRARRAPAPRGRAGEENSRAFPAGPDSAVDAIDHTA